MDPREFLALAQQLNLAMTEVAWRSAVSRAYYAAFHVARQLLEDLGFTVPHGDRAHGYLWLRLSNCGDPLVQRAGRDLNALRRDRNGADYDLARPMGPVVPRLQLPLAAQIIQALDAARMQPTRTTISDAMKIYERDVLHDVTWHP
jgi:hypothetical protein